MFVLLMKNTTDPYFYYSLSGNLPDDFIADNNWGITVWKRAGERY